MKRIIKCERNVNEDDHDCMIYIDGEFEFTFDEFSNGSGIYDWSQCTDTFANGDVLELVHDDKTYRVYMHKAWPVQIAGPRLTELHTFTAGWTNDESILKVAPDNIIELTEPEYVAYDQD